MDKDKVIEELKKRASYYKACFKGEAGEYVLEDLKRRCYYNVPTYSKDGMEMAYREGIRSVYLHIRGMVEEKGVE